MNKKPIRTVGPWAVLSERKVFDNPWIRILDQDVLHPDGSPGQYGLVQFKNTAIGIMPFDAGGNVRLVGQHRYPHDAYSWELPEGGGPVDENPLENAKRELKEETGLEAGEWFEYYSFDISNSVTDEKAVCFLAWNLSEGEASPDPSEDLATRIVPFSNLLEMVLKGEIRDSLTIVMTLAAYAMALKGGLPEPICEIIAPTPR